MWIAVFSNGEEHDTGCDRNEVSEAERLADSWAKDCLGETDPQYELMWSDDDED